MAKREFRILIFLGIAVAAMIFLSAGLSQLEFSPGRPLPRLQMSPLETAGGWASGNGSIVLLVFRALLALSLVLLPVLIVYLIVSPKARKRVLRQIATYSVLVLFFYILARRMHPLAFNQGVDGANAPSSFPDGGLGSAAEFIAAAPPWLAFVISLVIALIIVGVIVGLVWLIARRRQLRPSPLRELAQTAQEALEALQGGADLKNAVMRCYLEMSRVVSQRRGIRRQADMTPHEFEIELEEAGLPGEPVHQLTRLFEEVRYGDKMPGEREGQQAITCLQAIVAAAGG